jgi:hypothetical protein
MEAALWLEVNGLIISSASSLTQASNSVYPYRDVF